MDIYNLAGKNFTLENVQKLQQLCSSSQDCLSYMGEVLDLRNYMVTARQAFILDFFYGINLFAGEINLSIEQAVMMFDLGKDLLCSMLGGKSFKESEEFFKERILSLNTMQSDADLYRNFSPIDLRKIIDFFIFTFFQHHALYKHCFSKECCTENRREVVHIESALILPLSEASSKEELEAQELAAREALEAEEKARQTEVQEKAEAERVAAEEALKIEESKKKRPQSLDEAIEFVVREKLETFKQSFFEGCASEQKRIIEKLAQIEASVSAGIADEKKPKKATIRMPFLRYLRNW